MDVDIERIREDLEAGIGYVALAVAGHDDAVLAHHASPDEWCAKQVLGHLIEADTEVFGALIPGILDRDPPPGWDSPPSMIRDDCGRDARDLLWRFFEARRRGVALVRSLRPEDLSRTTDRNWHRGPDESVGDLLHHWPEHTRAHVKQARQAVAAGLEAAARARV